MEERPAGGVSAHTPREEEHDVRRGARTAVRPQLQRGFPGARPRDQGTRRRYVDNR